MARNISKNTGKGRDSKGRKSDGLRWSWKWLKQCELSGALEKDKRRLPCQTCFAEAQTKLGWWRFEAVDWHDGYEARASLNGKVVVLRVGLPTRFEAQRCAEFLIKEFCEMALAELYP